MNKRILLWSLVALLIGGAAFIKFWLTRQGWASAESEAEVNQPVTEKQTAEYARKIYGSDAKMPAPLAPLELKRPVRLALGPLGLADDEQNGRLSDFVLTDLSGAQGLNLVERQSLDAVLRELNLSWSGLVRAQDAVRAGKLLKADWFLLGTGAKINGTNSLVIRVVDARTGILRDAGVFPTDRPLTQLAGDVAAFARGSRQNAASGKTPVFLAIGGFEDLGINNRQAGFPAELRSHLTSFYQGTGVTLLEREYVDTLLKEVYLDLAGLTEGSATNAPAPMQSAYWLVSGSYQSFETTNLQVELQLNVQRIFGLVKHVTLRGLPGEPVSRQVKQAIDEVMNQSQGGVYPTRISEVRAQMSLGKDFVASDSPGLGGDYFLTMPLYSEGKYMDSFTGRWILPASLKRRRNLEEAVRAFETVLLLDPGNREAKMYLAACLQDPLGKQSGDPRQYYFDIIESPVQDNWSGMARQALIRSFVGMMGRMEDPAGKARWFEAAAQQTTNSSAKDFYSKQAQEAGHAAALASGEVSESQEVAEQRMFEAFKPYSDVLHNKSGVLTGMGMPEFAATFGTNRAAAARKLVELIPEMRSKYRELEPFFLASVVMLQVDTNAPVIAEFQQKLAEMNEHPTLATKSPHLWTHLALLCRWGFDHKLYGLVAQVLESDLRAADLRVAALPASSRGQAPRGVYSDLHEDKVALGFAYMGMEHWQQARDVFDNLTNRPVKMYDRGPWGREFITVLPGDEAAFCAKKLGQTPAHDAREFNMGEACFCLCTPSTFAVDESGLWVGINNQLLHLDFDLKTNLAVTLPKDVGTPVYSLCFNGSTVWIGTDGDGLFEFDKTSRQCRQLTEQDGLMMNSVASLHLAGTVLWIGYGNSHGEGGLGRLDLTTRQITSFTRPLGDLKAPLTDPNMEDASKPTRRPVIAIIQGAEEDVWFVSNNSLRYHRMQDTIWKQAQPSASSLAMDQGRLFVGQFWNYMGEDKSGLLGVSILGLKDGKWRTLKADGELPSAAVNAVAVQGNDLWLGGKSYVALFDLEKEKVRKFARVKAEKVDQLQIGGGYLWAQYDWHLHRVLLQNVK